jgi:hypothetical protein
MKKKKYYYEHRYASDASYATSSEIKEFYEISNVKLYNDGNKFYTYEFAGNEVSWFTFLKSEEVEIAGGVTKLPTDDRYANGINWKNVQMKGVNSRLPSDKGVSPYDKLNKGKPPINPKTGRRDGGV